MKVYRNLLVLLLCVCFWSANSQTSRKIYATIEKINDEIVFIVKDYAENQIPEVGGDILKVSQDYELEYLDSLFLDPNNPNVEQEIKAYEFLARAWGYESDAEMSDAQSLHSQAERAIVDIDPKISPKNCNFWFYNLKNIKSIEGLEKLNTKDCQSMRMMFAYCTSLEEINVSNFLTSSVITMRGMFNQCNKLQKVDILGFITEQLEEAASMFNRCTSLKRVDLSNFSFLVSKDIQFMFSGCTALESIFVASKDFQMPDDAYVFRDCKNLVGRSFETEDTVQWAEGEGEEDDEKTGLRGAMGRIAEEGGYLSYVERKEGLHLKQTPTKLLYKKGEELDLKGGIIAETIVWNNGETLEFEYATDNLAASGFNSNKSGKQTVKITYRNFDFDYEIEVDASANENLEAACNFSVWTDAETIFVKLKKKLPVELCTMDGKIIARKEAVSDVCEFKLGKKALYIVKVGGETKKVVLK